jgi:hypothetical protein
VLVSLRYIFCCATASVTVFYSSFSFLFVFSYCYKAMRVTCSYFYSICYREMMGLVVTQVISFFYCLCPNGGLVLGRLTTSTNC